MNMDMIRARWLGTIVGEVKIILFQTRTRWKTSFFNNKEIMRFMRENMVVLVLKMSRILELAVYLPNTFFILKTFIRKLRLKQTSGFVIRKNMLSLCITNSAHNLPLGWHQKGNLLSLPPPPNNHHCSCLFLSTD